MTIVRKFAVLAMAASVAACSEVVDEPLWFWQPGKELRQAIGFNSNQAKLLYSWRNCCWLSEQFGGESPGSICVVYQLGKEDFDSLYAREYPRYEPRGLTSKSYGLSSGEGCRGTEGGKHSMKGCSGFEPGAGLQRSLKLQVHGQTCSGDTGTILKIDVENRLVAVERYFWE